MDEYKESQLDVISLNETDLCCTEMPVTDVDFDNIQQKIHLFNESQILNQKIELAHNILASFQNFNLEDIASFDFSGFFEAIKDLIYENNESIIREINYFAKDCNVLKDALIHFKIYDSILFFFVSMNTECKRIAINVLSQMNTFDHCFLCSFYETILKLKKIDDLELISTMLIHISETTDCVNDLLKILQYCIVDLNFYQNSLPSFLILMKRSKVHCYKAANTRILQFITQNFENISNNFLEISIGCIELSLPYRKIPENFFSALNFEKLKNIFQNSGKEEEIHKIALFLSHLYSSEDYFGLIHNTEIEKVIFEIFSLSCYEIKKELASNIAISMRYITYNELMTDFFQNIFDEVISIAESGETDVIVAIIDTVIRISDTNPDFLIHIQKFYSIFEDIYMSTDDKYLTDLLDVFLTKIDKFEEYI